MAGACQIYFDDKKIGHPTDHALHDFDLYVIKEAIDKKVGQINVNKGKCHGVAAHDPAAMGNKTFVTGSVISHPRHKKPASRHCAKPYLGDEKVRIPGCNGQNCGGADKAAQNIDFTKTAMNVRILYAPSRNKQKRSDHNSRYSGGNMNGKEQVTDDGQARDYNRGINFVAINWGVQEVLDRNI